MSERRKSRRYVLFLPALCWGPSRSDFYAVTEDISVDGIRLRSATIPEPQEDLVVSLAEIGRIEAKVLRNDARSFVVRVVGRGRPVADLARHLVALSRRQDGESAA